MRKNNIPFRKPTKNPIVLPRRKQYRWMKNNLHLQEQPVLLNGCALPEQNIDEDVLDILNMSDEQVEAELGQALGQVQLAYQNLIKGVGDSTRSKEVNNAKVRDGMQLQLRGLTRTERKVFVACCQILSEGFMNELI